MVDRFRLVPAAYVLLLRGPGGDSDRHTRIDGPDSAGRSGVGGGPDTEVLLQLRGRTGFRDGHWAAAAAGHVEYGESVYAAAAREAAEELGIRLHVADLEPLCTVQRTDPGNPDPVEQRVDFFLTARSWEGQPTIREPVKCQELRWCRLGALPEPVVPHERQVLELLARGEVPAIVTSGF